jgi:hypothetical protein
MRQGLSDRGNVSPVVMVVRIRFGRVRHTKIKADELNIRGMFSGQLPRRGVSQRVGVGCDEVPEGMLTLIRGTSIFGKG